MATRDRHLTWEGSFNVRDLGGFPVAGGGETRWGAIVRADTPERLTEAGWAALDRHGIRTIVDLRDHSEHGEAHGTGLLSPLLHPVLDFADSEFWDAWRGVHDTSRFYREILSRWPQRFAGAAVAVATAPPGGVLINCQVGRDRTGLMAALLLSVVGVADEEIAADYALSAVRLQPLYEQLIDEAPDETVRDRLRRENVSSAEAILDVLAHVKPRDYLLGGGASEQDLEAIAARLLP